MSKDDVPAHTHEATDPILMAVDFLSEAKDDPGFQANICQRLLSHAGKLSRAGVDSSACVHVQLYDVDNNLKPASVCVRLMAYGDRLVKWQWSTSILGMGPQFDDNQLIIVSDSPRRGVVTTPEYAQAIVGFMRIWERTSNNAAKFVVAPELWRIITGLDGYHKSRSEWVDQIQRAHGWSVGREASVLQSMGSLNSSLLFDVKTMRSALRMARVLWDETFEGVMENQERLQKQIKKIKI